MTDAHIYYERVVLDYLVGDTKHLLEIEEPRSGILLGPVVNGIDTIGGMLLGFNAGSRKRSVHTMIEHMGYATNIAEFIYVSLRCGLVHQGTSKTGLWFYALHGEFHRPSPIYKDAGWLYLDSVALARNFVTAAELLWEQKRSLIRRIPEPHDDGFLALASDSLIPAIDEFEGPFMRFLEATHGSTSAFKPDRYLNPALKVTIDTQQDVEPDAGDAPE